MMGDKPLRPGEKGRIVKWKTYMKRLSAAVAIFLSGVVVGCNTTRMIPKGPIPQGLPTARPEGAGWIDLLDSANATAWRNTTDDLDIFELNDGVLHIFGRTVHPLRYVTYTAQEFDDFDLHLEFKLSPRANSGIFLRAQANDPVYRGFEVQVLDDYGRLPTKNSCGAIYDVVTPMFNMSRPAGEWNSFDITVVGKSVSIVMNGWTIIQTDLSKMTTPLGKFKVAYNDLPLSGFLALQDHGGEVWYRNMLIRPRRSSVQ